MLCFFQSYYQGSMLIPGTFIACFAGNCFIELDLKLKFRACNARDQVTLCIHSTGNIGPKRLILIPDRLLSSCLL